MKEKTIRLGRHLVGEGRPVFMVAETGTNHGGNIEVAVKMIEAAKRAGADAVKFQTIDAEASYIRGTLPHKAYGKIRFTKDDWMRLKRAANQNGILFFSAPADIPSVDMLKAVKIPVVKISSGSMTNIALARRMASLKVPVMISTGMSYLSEVKGVVREFEKNGVRDIIILHCTSLYPAEIDQLNLEAIRALKRTFSYPIGYSDHTISNIPSVAAVCLGAKVLEKHFTVDRRVGGPEQRFSLLPDQLRDWVEEIRCTETALGTGKKVPSPRELASRDKNRRCLVANTDIKKGEVITADMIGMKRPLARPGLSTASFVYVLGRKAKRDIKGDSPIYSTHI